MNGPERIVYPENGTWPLATYTATANPDRPIHGWIIAVQPGGGDGDFFDIDDDGNLTFTQPPDYEDPADDNGDNTYSFSLHVYDTNPPNGERPAQTFFSVSVTVTNETVEALEIRGPSAVDYAEDRTDAVATYTLDGTSAPVEWSLSGADGGEFSIDANVGLTFNREPDYENPTDTANENAYLVTITAYAGERSKTEFVRVRVTDVNEPPEFDDGETATRSVDRNLLRQSGFRRPSQGHRSGWGRPDLHFGEHATLPLRHRTIHRPVVCQRGIGRCPVQLHGVGVSHRQSGRRRQYRHQCG